jgi:hypothetical protein
MLRKETIEGLGAEHLRDVLSSRLGLHLEPVPLLKHGTRAAMRSVGSRYDFAFDVRGIQPPRRIHVEVKSRFLREHLQAFVPLAHELRVEDPSAVPLLMVPHLSRRGRDDLRAAGVNHADLSGVVFVRDAGFYIDLEGVQSHEGSAREADRQGAYRVNPFSDKASLVSRVLLEAAGRPLHHSDISARAQVTKGWVSLVARELVRRKYVERGAKGVRMIDAIGVLKDWAGVYSWNRNRMVSFVAPFEYEELLSNAAASLREIEAGWALTLLAGMDRVASHVQHGQVHVYVRPADFGRAESKLRSSLHLERVAHGGNFHLLEPYHAVSAFFGRREVKGIPVVSDIQLYLDLVGYPVRGSESVEVLLRGGLGHALGLDSRHFGELL